MKVLMISSDPTFLGKGYTGDVLERHQEYARRAGSLDVFVFSKKGIRPKFGKYDLIVCQDPFFTGLIGYLFKVFLKVPLLVHFHGDFWENEYLKINKYKLRLSKFLVNKADGIRVVSQGIKDKLVKAGVSEEKIRVISTPVNVAKFASADQEKVNNLRLASHEKKVIINVGRNDSSKDYQTLEKAIALVREGHDIEFVQFGAKHKSIEQAELVNCYHASDIYVSSSCHESFGKVLVEAMAAGLPLVATETTGSKEIIDEGVNGFLVPIGNAEELAEKINFLIDNPDRAKEMGQRGKEMAQKYDSQVIVPKIIEFWKDLTKKG